MIETILSIQQRMATAVGGMTTDEIVLLKSKQLLEVLPEPLLLSDGKKEQFKMINGLYPSLTTVLIQELEKFNLMLVVMRRSLVDIEKAIHGFIAMSSTLDGMYLCF